MRLGPRPASRQRGPLTTVAVAGTLLVAVAALGWFALRAPSGIPGASYYTVEAELEDLSNLGSHSEIRLAGERVGQVLEPRIDESGQPVVELQLDESIAPLRRDSRVVVRSKSLLGQRFLELRPGRDGPPLREGERLPAARSFATVELPEVINAFDEPRREALRIFLRELSQGTLARGEESNRAIADSPALLQDLDALSGALLARDGAPRRFFPSLESAAAAADPVRREIAEGFRPAARALRPLSERRAALQTALETAPGALAKARRGLSAADPLIVQLGRFGSAAEVFLEPAEPALRETTGLLREAEGALRATPPFLRAAERVASPLASLADRALPLLPRVDDALRLSLPPLSELGSRPCDLLGWASNWRSMLGYGVAGGGEVGPLNALRLQLIGSPESLAGGAEAQNSERIGRNPYPDPCEAGTEELP